MWIAVLTIALLALLLTGVSLALLQRRAREAQQREQRLLERIGVLENELSAMMDGAFGVASQLQKVETNLKSTVQQQEQLQQRDMGNLPYNEAVRRVSKGANVDELVEHCGLSRSEAELVEMLHKKAQPPIVAESVDAPVGHRMTISEEELPQPDELADQWATAQPGENSERADAGEKSEDELGMDNAPLFSGELGGEGFQQALERAREYQSAPDVKRQDNPQGDDERTEK